MARILIVQDEFLEAERLRQLLEKAGHFIVGVVARTDRALDTVRQERLDLAIVDMMLEIDIDGIATATAIHRASGCRILITTGFPDWVIKAEGVDDLACAIIKKPYKDQELLDALNRCLA